VANTFSRHWRLLLVVIGAIALLWVLYWLRLFLLPFGLGLLLTYLLHPVVVWLERHLPPRRKWAGFRRVMAVVMCFILLIVIIGGFLYIVINAVVDSVVVLVDSAPAFIAQTIVRVQTWINNAINSLPISLREGINSTLVSGGVDVGNSIRTALLRSIPSLGATLNLVLGFAVIPFFLFYLLKDVEKLQTSVMSVLSGRVAFHTRNVAIIIERVVGRYLKSQLMLGVIVGYFAFVGLLILGIPSQYSLALGLLAGFTEMIPTIGPWIGGTVAAIVSLAIAPDKILWVILLFVAIQLLENHLLVPKVQGSFLHIHPAAMLFLLVLGIYMAGFWGALFIGPLTALIVEIVKYVRDCQRPPAAPGLTSAEG
jgi:predicted PurR-regulated permease PerM